MNRRIPQLHKIIASSILLLIVGFFYYQIRETLQWPAKEYADPAFFNLTAKNHPWEVYLGSSPRCGEIDCYLRADWSLQAPTRLATLPIKEFPLRGYRTGDFIYYRTKVHLPASLINTPASLVFHSYYIWAANYELYINEELVQTGASEQVNAVIPPRFLQTDGALAIAIKVDPRGLPYQGLSHYGQVVIGPKAKLGNLPYRLRDTKTSNYLWSLLPRLTFCLLFCFVYLAFSRNQENFSFLLFAFTASLKPLLASAYAQNFLPPELLQFELNTGTEVCSQLFFILFVHHFFRDKGLLVPLLVKAAFVAAAVYFSAAFLALAPDAAAAASNALAKAVRLIALGYAVYLSAFTAWLLFQRGALTYRFYVAASLGILFFTSALSLSWSLLGGGVPWGGTVEAIYELALFTLIAATLAFEFAVTYHRKDKFNELVKEQAKALAETEVDRSLARMTQMVAHDIRKPFSMFKTILTTMKFEKNPQRQREIVEQFIPRVESLVMAVESMLSDIMDLGIKPSQEREDFSLGDLLREVIAESAIPAAKNITVTSDLMSNDEISGHREKFKRAVGNIINNALEAVNEDGTIWIKCRKVLEGTTRKIEMTIGNSGSFIPIEKIPRIFESFYTSGKRGGTGLGLAVSKKIFEAYGGEITCISSRTTGTEFHISLPAAITFDVYGRSIIVIDDDPFIGDLWKADARFAAVHYFSSPEIFLAEMAKDSEPLKSIAVVICDFYFDQSELNGAMLAKFIKGLSPATPVFLSTDASSVEHPDLIYVDRLVRKGTTLTFEKTKPLLQLSS